MDDSNEFDFRLKPLDGFKREFLDRHAGQLKSLLQHLKTSPEGDIQDIPITDANAGQLFNRIKDAAVPFGIPLELRSDGVHWIIDAHMLQRVKGEYEPRVKITLLANGDSKTEAVRDLVDILIASETWIKSIGYDTDGSQFPDDRYDDSGDADWWKK